MSSSDLLIVNSIGPAFTKKTESLGGSEHELVLLAHAFAKKGAKVVFANWANTTDETIDGVRYVYAPAVAGIDHARAVILARTTLMPPGLSFDRVAVRATDNYFSAYDGNKGLLHTHAGAWLVPMSAWQGQQAGFQALAARQRVIHPMIQPSPPLTKKPLQYVFASGPMKGLQATIDEWEELYDGHVKVRELRPALIIAAPGHYVRHYPEQFPALSATQRETYNIHYASSDGPHPRPISTDEYLQVLGESEGLFYVNVMQETFGMVASLAERARCRPFIIALHGSAGLAEALDDQAWLFDCSRGTDADKINAILDSRRAFLRGLGVPYTPPSQHIDRSPEAMLPAWEELLFEQRKQAVVVGPMSPAVRGELLAKLRVSLARVAQSASVSDHWKARCEALAEHAKDLSDTGFLRWTEDLDISDGNGADFASWWRELAQDDQMPRWRYLSRVAPWGNPHTFALDGGTSPTALQHTYHLYKFEKETGQRFIEGIDVVLEIGGGHGNFARMLRADGFKGAHIIVDLPHVREFQRLFLSLCEINVTDARELIDGVTLLVEEDLPHLVEIIGGKRLAVVSTFGLSETPHAFRKKLWPVLQTADKFLLAVLGWPEWHGIDNKGFFEDLIAQYPGTDWAFPRVIEGFQPALVHSTRYIFGAAPLGAKGQKRAASIEYSFPADPALEANKASSGPFFGKFIDLLKGALAPGGCELGAGLTLFSLAASTKSRQIVEIGRFKGFSTLALAAALELQRIGWQEAAHSKQRPDVDYVSPPKGGLSLVSIDPNPTREADELLEQAGLSKLVVKIDKRSEDVDLKGPIDLLFIDGSHEYGDLRRDIEKYVPWVKHGGYFVLRDYFGWYKDGPNGKENGSPIAKVVRENLQGFDRILIDTSFASLIVFRKTQNLTEPKDLDIELPVAPPRKDGRPTVGLVIIAKGDEVATVAARTIASVKHQVDAITVVCDAAPETARVVELMGADVVIRRTPKTDWENGIGFIAGARNEALLIAERRTDYVLFADPDDYFEGAIPKELDRDAYDVVIRDGALEYPRPLLFRGKRGYRYTGIRHESLTFDGATTGRLEGLRYVRGKSTYGHQDQDEPAVKFRKHARDLEKWLLDHPDDTRATFYLGQSYADAGDFEKALTVYERRAGMGGFAEEAWLAMVRVGDLQTRLGRDPTSAYLRAHSMMPWRAEPLYALAKWYGEAPRHQFEIAYLFARQASSLPAPHAQLFFNRALYAHEALTVHAHFATLTGRLDEAATLLTALIDRVPADRKASTQAARDAMVADLQKKGRL